MADAITALHVADPSRAELEEHLTALTVGLSQRRAQVVVAGPLERPLREALGRGSVRWANLPLPVTLGGRGTREATTALTRLARNLKAEIIHAHGWIPATLCAAVRREVPEAHLVVSPHGPPPLAGEGWLATRSLRRALRSALQSTNVVVATSEAEAAAAEALWNQPGLRAQGRILVIPPGVEARRRSSLYDVGVKRKRVGLHTDASVVVAATDLEPGSPVEAFLHAAALVADRLPNVEFCIIGGGSRLEELQALAHNLRLSGSTVFLGRRTDTLDVVACCNVLAALGGDPWSAATALQALSRELRVVAADSPELREVFEGHESVPLVPLTDHAAFADAICRQLEGLTVEEGALEATTGLAWGVSEVLASQDEFDLDAPGLTARDRGLDSASDQERLLREFSLDRMLRRYAEVYRRLLRVGDHTMPSQEG